MAYKQQGFLFTFLEAGKQRIKSPADLVSVEDLLPALYMAVFSLGLLMAADLSEVSSIRARIPFTGILITHRRPDP